ncbi:hypothetical protein A7E78_07875 [Syntrophotalea acetylenivorans]|uniref:PilZ domain-containing protein n=1 Tax=Syntrophotalea acetylenivorans TaxID=1842532 RepID=A0A1L3GP95_9BACT|nr:PilZ domain-containing protein [Syntrophotalea acetylenivorans]APG27761.1 hypothetical protein A7E78_07875 [Syntrophotalea acetylenivorans]
MYSRYFTPGQRLQVQTLYEDNLPARREAMNVLFTNYELGYFDVAIPHSWPVKEGLPFPEGSPLEIVSERYGLWLKSSASFHSQPSDKVIRLRMNDDLCIFRHSPQQRVETQIGLCYSARRGDLPTFHRQWRQQIKKLSTTATALTAPSFSRGQVNLSASGIRMPLQTAVEKNDLCLLMLSLDDASDPICTLTEVIWTAPQEEGQGITTGMQFLNILQKDQQRIEQFVNRNLPRKTKGPAVADR